MKKKHDISSNVLSKIKSEDIFFDVLNELDDIIEKNNEIHKDILDLNEDIQKIKQAILLIRSDFLNTKYRQDEYSDISPKENNGFSVDVRRPTKTIFRWLFIIGPFLGLILGYVIYFMLFAKGG